MFGHEANGASSLIISAARLVKDGEKEKSEEEEKEKEEGRKGKWRRRRRNKRKRKRGHTPAWQRWPFAGSHTHISNLCHRPEAYFDYFSPDLILLLPSPPFSAVLLSFSVTFLLTWIYNTDLNFSNTCERRFEAGPSASIMLYIYVCTCMVCGVYVVYVNKLLLFYNYNTHSFRVWEPKRVSSCLNGMHLWGPSSAIAMQLNRKSQSSEWE